jgi:hypothetical protein
MSAPNMARATHGPVEVVAAMGGTASPAPTRRREEGTTGDGPRLGLDGPQWRRSCSSSQQT